VANLETGTTQIMIDLRTPKDFFLIRESAALAANSGLKGETVVVESQGEALISRDIPKSVVVSGTPRQITVFEELLTGAERASRKIEEFTRESLAAYEAGIRDHFQLQAIRLGLQRAA
jgi:hypothetical protein